MLFYLSNVLYRRFTDRLGSHRRREIVGRELRTMRVTPWPEGYRPSDMWAYTKAMQKMEEALNLHVAYAILPSAKLAEILADVRQSNKERQS
ncbi:hypothetical protein [Schleiferilactobacillus shenzhenensis]|uniref:Uncharacterized protein n=1 Tax=Schleiferilactobacillus shenzhenensis LY-73 TaxID=1231336 RepID=U4TNV1_9LACO|nr:hypothetical protein [Schleiferilactobacillus shenzhenensis]ERL65125.1 hypothetical protein L248_3063 [Schleiferilactobacillus shenzhenensis LY-73]